MIALPQEPLLNVHGLKKHFGAVKAVEEVSFELKRGEVVGLVGESGSGKSTVGRTLLRLIEPTSGTLEFDGNQILNLSKRDMRHMRRRMQLIFQDPFSSLNPYMRVGQTLEEPLIVHRLRRTTADRRTRVGELLEMVGLRASHANRYPHEFSGGQRQRIVIARALASEPDFVVADEAVSALDVSVQAQIINLLRQLQSELQLAMLFIGHDLGVIRYLADRTMVMYLGRIVEMAPTEELFRNPRHPYTRALLSAIPDPDPNRAKTRVILKGDVPSPVNPPSGCAFRSRCPSAIAACADMIPPMRTVAANHTVACIRHEL